MFQHQAMTRSMTAILAAQMVACTAPRARTVEAQYPLGETSSIRISNLERAARYPWLDEGACAVREASNEWKVLVERCYHTLDLSRIRFQDREHRCAVANADAATVGQIVGVCLLVQPEIAVAAVIIVGTVIVAAAIAAELERANRTGCDCVCLGSGALDGKGKPVNDGPYWPPKGIKIRTAAQCDRACKDADYARGICRG